MIYTVTLNPSIDQHITLNKLVKDDTLRAQSVEKYPGGKGINVCRALKILGRPAKAFTFMGGYAGYILRDLLQKEEVVFDSTDVIGETRMNVILTDLSDRTQTRISMPGPEVQKFTLDILLEKIHKAEPRPSFWVLGGSLPPSRPVDTFRWIIQSLNDRGERCVLDADADVLEEGIKAKPFMIKPNEFEIERLAGRPLPGLDDKAKVAVEICRKGVEVVAVTLDGRGALVVTKDASYRAEAPRVEVKSKVGAGDSFIAGFLNALRSGKDIPEASREGVAAGTAAVIKEGTSLFTREDFERVRGLVQVEQMENCPAVMTKP
jgi:1-phosphofructokinase family hexose kinase